MFRDSDELGSGCGDGGGNGKVHRDSDDCGDGDNKMHRANKAHDHALRAVVDKRLTLLAQVTGP